MNTEVTPEVVGVFCDVNGSEMGASENAVIDLEEVCSKWPLNSENRSEMVSTDQNRVSLETSPVTHIEIIKSSSRRVTGANRVVPLLTSALKAGKHTMAKSGLSEVYKSVLCDMGSSDNNKKCAVCSEELLSCSELKFHAKEVHDLNLTTNECFVCSKKYVFEDQLKYHLKQIHGIHNPDLICKICFMEFSTIMEQKAHERKHVQTYSCQMCMKKFSTEYLYQKHVSQHLVIQENSKECKKCGNIFKNDISLIAHEKRHVSNQCILCKMDFKCDVDMLKHIKKHSTEEAVKFLDYVEKLDNEENHLEEMLTIYSKISKAKKNQSVESVSPFLDNDVQSCLSDILSVVSQVSSCNIEKKTGIECKLCGKSVATSRELLEHRRVFHLRNRTCLFCGKRSKSVSLTWRHMRSHIMKNKSGESKANGTLEANDSLTRSKLHHSNPRPYGCNICSRKYLYPGSRDNHVLQHSKDKCDSWTCTICGDLFSHPSLLLSHLSVHEPVLICNICKKQFYSQSTLVSHLKSHTDEDKKRARVHKCTVCSVECLTVSGLQTHIRCHTGERPYSCGQCQRSFKRLQAVKKHIQVVHDSANLQYHSCTDCSKTFKSTGNMVRHYLRIHCQLRRFICGICGSRFSQNQDLRRHFKILHSLDMPNISGTDRKALKEIYVIPGIDNLPDTHPHAMKIKTIVDEEKAKFQGLSLVYSNISKNCAVLRGQDVQSVAQFIEEFSTENDEVAVVESSPSSNETNELMKGVVSVPDHKMKNNTLAVEYNSEHTVVVSPNKDSNSNWILCKVCSTQYLGEDEFLKHIAVGSGLSMCERCGLSFCDDVLLSYHLSNDHKEVESNVVVNDITEKENSLLGFQDTQGVETVNHVMNMRCELVQHNNLLIEPCNSLTINSEDLLTVAPDASQHANSFSPENILSVASVSCNLEDPENNYCNMPAALNINGVIVQNIFIHRVPGILQSVPFALENQAVINPSTVTPVVALNSLPVSNDDHCDPPLFNVNSIHDDSQLNVSNSTAQKIWKDVSKTVEENKNDLSPPIETLETVENHDTNNSIAKSNVVENQRRELNEKGSLKKVKSHHVKVSRNKKHQTFGKATCELCGEKFFNNSSLNRHMKCHTESKPFSCCHCGKYFAEKWNLRKHLMTHTGERPYTCDTCGMQIRYMKDLLDHKRTHVGEKPFGCEECGRRFIRRRELIRHKFIHTGEKKHVCPVCGKAFARLDQLKLGHLPTHGQSKPQFTCSICNESFKLKSTLKQHEFLHSGLKEFQCELCQKCFALEGYLKAHMKSHKKRDSFLLCSKCHRRFAKESTLQVHEESCGLKQKRASKKKHKLVNENTTSPQNIDVNTENTDLENYLGADIEIQDVDLSMLDADSSNAVIYLHMTPEDMKLTFSNDDKLFAS